MYEEYWRDWWSNRSSVYSNIVDTSKYDVINGKTVERADYKKKRLETEREEIVSYIKHCEKAIVEKSKRKEEIDKELSPD